MTILRNVFNSIVGLFSSEQMSEFDQLVLGLGISNEVPKELAYMVVLVSLATIDNEFHKNEYAYIFNEMQKRFSLSHDQIKQSIKQVETMIAAAGGSQFVFDHIKKSFSVGERHELLEMIKGLVQVDSVVDGFESYLTDTYRKSLGLD